MPEWTPPSEFDGYRLVRPLGRGGMGQVFLGQDVLLERPVAVKFISALNPDEGHRQRFLQEGRAIARLSHPNVVSIHRVGEVQGHPYFVAEYVRGQPLDAVTKPLPWERVLRIGRGLARGLAAAHRQGVLHRDLKPSNIVVTESGETKLLDFGLAKLITELEEVEENGDDTGTRDLPRPRLDPSLTNPDLILGTPRYMAPEVLAGEPSSRKSDLFALGVVLYELCMGKVPERSGGRDLPPVRGVAGVNVRLAEIIDRCVSVDPEQRFASADELLDALEHVVPERLELVLPEGNPYRGLRPFEAEHRALFFGRDQEIRAVLERLRSDPRVVVAGDSGVGKSSLCRAGVLPLVNDGALGETSWRVVRLVPGRRPLVALAAALSPALEVNEEALGAWLSSEPAALARALQRARQKTPGFGLLVFVDQAEALFTLAPAPESAVVAEALGALGTTPHARVLIAVRGDFVTRLASLPVIGEDLASSLYLLRGMTAERLREVVVGPARARGFRYESDAMVEQLVESGLGSTGALPLLQFALAELWEARDEEHKLVPAAALPQLGGVEGALSRHADALLAALQPEQRDAVRRILLRLVTAEGTRARRTATELEARSGPASSALNALVGARLIVAREMEGEGTFELVHEALLTGWGTLRELLDAAADERRLLQRLESAAGEWERLGCPRELLWRGRQLAEARQLDRDLGQRESAFLERSADEVRRQKAWRMLGLVAVPLLILVALGAAQLRARHQVEAEVARQLVPGRAALEEGLRVAEEARSSAAEVFRLYDSTGPPTHQEARPTTPTRWELAEAAWPRVRELQAAAERALQQATYRLETAALLQPARADIQELLAKTLLAEIELAEAVDFNPPDEVLLEKLRTHDARGQLVSRLQRPGTIQLEADTADAVVELERYRTAAGQLVPELVSSGAVHDLASRAHPPGSYRVVVHAPGLPEVKAPFLLKPGSTVRLSIPLRGLRIVPESFLYIPGGETLVGVRRNDDLRVALGAPPIHSRRLSPFLIARFETTFGDWIQFLESQTPAKRRGLLPSVGAPSFARGPLSLRDVGGRWVLDFQPSEVRFVVPVGTDLIYPGRARNRAQDWTRMPVSGISYVQVVQYAAWRSRISGVPQRLCTETEWERASRGADGRSFTTGERVDSTHANFDLSYGRRPDAFGPDMVGLHPESASPTGVDDLQGNAMEIVRSDYDDAELLEKGGSWYHDLGFDGQLGARFGVEPASKALNLGFRLCADFPEGR